MPKKGLSVKEWKKFRDDMLRKWLRPAKFEALGEADKKYEDFMQSEEVMWRLRKKAGLEVGRWQKAKDPERLGGFRAQKWFDEMLWDMDVIPHYSELKGSPFFSLSQWEQLEQKIEQLDFNPEEAFGKWLKIYYAMEIGFDMCVGNFGPIEVKSLPFGKNEFVNIKRDSWDAKPSAYLAALETCDRDMLEFRLVGWLYGYEVFRLPVEDLRYTIDKSMLPHYFCKVENLRKPKKLLNMLLKISRKKPKLKKHSD